METNKDLEELGSIPRAFLKKCAIETSTCKIDYKEFLSRVHKAVSVMGTTSTPSSIVIFLPVSIDLFIIVHAAIKLKRTFILAGSDNGIESTLKSVNNLMIDYIVAPFEWANKLAMYPQYKILNIEFSNDIILLRRDKRYKLTSGTFVGNIPFHQIAYIVFTSGSTGIPKAVAISWESLDYYSRWYSTKFQISGEDRIAVACSSGFDMILNALVPSILSRACVVIPTRAELLDPKSFMVFLKEKNISLINFTPAYAELLTANAIFDVSLPNLRIVEFGGEALMPETARKWQTVAPNADLYNCYGVAEATVTSFVHHIQNIDLQKTDSIPIGKPVDGMKFEIVRSKFKKQNQEGILKITGPLVGLGYLGMSDNDSKFSINKAGQDRSYNTGDFVKIDDQGFITYFGRKDRQIKISGGYRLNLKQVESKILEAGIGVEEVVVVQGKGTPPFLYAFCVTNKFVTEEEIKQVLENELSRHVRLAGVYFVEKMPLTKNNKINLSELREAIQDVSAIDAKNNTKQQTVINILHDAWKETLGIDVLGNSEEDFFKLGGTSFAFAKMIGLVESMTDITVKTENMLEDTSFSGQVGCLKKMEKEETDNLINMNTCHYYKMNSEDCVKESSQSKDVYILGAGVVAPRISGMKEFEKFLLEGRANTSIPINNRFIDTTFNIEDYTHNCFKKNEINEWRKTLSISSEAIESLDPQYLLWINAAKQAISNSGLSLKGKKVGVFVGLGPTFYRADSAVKAESDWALAGTTPSFAPGLLAYEMDFSGPNLVVDTACSSSLVAIHLASQSIRTGEVDIAIAGGAQLFNSVRSFELINLAGIVSTSGQCKPFDIDADGYIPGEGAGAVVLSSANIAENSQPICKILGSVTNHDGKTHTPTMPNRKRQVDLYREVLYQANISPDEVAFIEAHGTGTVLGDPIEVAGIKDVFLNSSRQEKLYIGSAKAYLGHLHYAAGVIGLIKAILQVKKNKVFSQPNLGIINPRLMIQNIDMISIPKTVCALENNLNIGIVNAFGFSGTNCSICIADVTGKLNLERNFQGNQDFGAGSTIHDEVKLMIADVIVNELKIQRESILFEESAISNGLDSISCLYIADELQEKLDIQLPSTIFLEEPTLQDALYEIVDLLQRSGEKTLIPVNAQNSTNGKESIKNKGHIMENYKGESAATEEIIRYFNSVVKLMLSTFEKEGAVSNLEFIKDILKKQHDLIEKFAPMSNFRDSCTKGVDEQVMLHSIHDYKCNENSDIKNIVAHTASLPLSMIMDSDDLGSDLGITSLQRMEMCTEIMRINKGDMELFDKLLNCDTILQINTLLGISAE